MKTPDENILEDDITSSTDDNNIISMKELISPQKLIDNLSLNEQTAKTIEESRKITQNIIYKKDPRVVAIVGPCSIHDIDSALEYAKELKEIANEVKNLHIIMRVYFEKPRTTVGWKGLINDPDLDRTFNVEKGITKARELLLKINEMGLTVSTEFLDLITPQYLSDLITWGAIGARTTESQSHRELASGLSPIIGFKNGTTGDTQIAIDAINSASNPQTIVSISKAGYVAYVNTSGNKYTHLILRGGKDGPNYYETNVKQAGEDLKKGGIKTGIMIDASHANSNKNHENQPKVIDNIAEQIENGNEDIVGVMIESNINSGKQKYIPGESDKKALKPGVSITDGCISIEETRKSLKRLDKAVEIRRNK